MIDLLYLAFNRLEFTQASLVALHANTDWELIRRLVIYDDGSTDGTLDYLHVNLPAMKAELRHTQQLGPVGIMNHYLRSDPAEIFGKIDNDTMVPPGWLPECLKLMTPQVDLLGIEPRGEVGTPHGIEKASFIGGIGLMRTKAFVDYPSPNGTNGRFGFTEWQDRHVEVRKYWVAPALPVCLLDRLPIEPWTSLSKRYVDQGWQRYWPPYPLTMSYLWEWMK